MNSLAKEGQLADSDVQAQLGSKALALAWLLGARAYQDFKLGCEALALAWILRARAYQNFKPGCEPPKP